SACRRRWPKPGSNHACCCKSMTSSSSKHLRTKSMRPRSWPRKSWKAPAPPSSASPCRSSSRQGQRRIGKRRIERLGQADQPLAHVIAAIEAGDRVGCLFQPVEDVLAISELSFAHPLREVRHGFIGAAFVIENEEALHPRALHQEVALDAWPLRPRLPARKRGGAANDDAGAAVDVAQHGIADAPGGVVEIDVDAVGTGGGERRVEVAGRLVVDRRVIAEFIAAEPDFLRPAGDADRATSPKFRDL